MGAGLEVIQRARILEEQLDKVVVSKERDEDEEDDPEHAHLLKDLPVVATNTPESASWLAGAINATVDGTVWEVPRPRGRILRRGYFAFHDPDWFGRFYCVAWRYTDPGQRPSGFSLGDSEDRVLVQRIVDRLNTLIEAEPPEVR